MLQDIGLIHNSLLQYRNLKRFLSKCFYSQTAACIKCFLTVYLMFFVKHCLSVYFYFFVQIDHQCTCLFLSTVTENLF